MLIRTILVYGEIRAAYAHAPFVNGILPNSVVTIVDAQWHGSDVVELTYKDASGAEGYELVFRDRETTLSILEKGVLGVLRQTAPILD